MARRISFAALLVAATIAAAGSTSVLAQERVESPIVVSHPVLVASVERLAAESALWRDAMQAVAFSGRRAVLLTPDKVNGTFDSGKLAQALALADTQSRVNTVVVVINLELLQRLSGLPVEAIQFKDDLDRIVAHEVYGHAVPYLLAGHMSGERSDPAAGQAATDACAIKRENEIRKEMGLGRRLDYGRESLSIARRSWQ